MDCLTSALSGWPLQTREGDESLVCSNSHLAVRCSSSNGQRPVLLYKSAGEGFLKLSRAKTQFVRLDGLTTSGELAGFRKRYNNDVNDGSELPKLVVKM